VYEYCHVYCHVLECMSTDECMSTVMCIVLSYADVYKRTIDMLSDKGKSIQKIELVNSCCINTYM